MVLCGWVEKGQEPRNIPWALKVTARAPGNRPLSPIPHSEGHRFSSSRVRVEEGLRGSEWRRELPWWGWGWGPGGHGGGVGSEEVPGSGLNWQGFG